MVLEVALALLVLDVAQGVGRDVDLERPAAVVAEGDPREAHLPAVEVTVDVDGGVGHAVVDEVVAGGHGELPVGCEAEVAAEADALDGLALEVALTGDIGADVAEGVADADVPGYAEIDIAAHEHGGAVVVGGL